MPDAESLPLSLHFRFSVGDEELRVPVSHPAFAAFRRGMEDGQLTGTWRFLLASIPPARLPTIVGTVVETPNGRFLYFPGAAIEVSTETQGSRFEQYRPLDHVTLDQPKSNGEYRSHIAVSGLPANNKSRGAEYRSHVTPGYLLPWFSLLVPALDEFVRIPGHLWVEFPPPRRDVEAFGKQLMANGGMIHVPLPTASSSDHYIQFDVWVGHGADWQSRRVQFLPWSSKLGILTREEELGAKIHCASVDQVFGPESGIRVCACQPLGELREPRILRPTFNPQQ
jgi:hypothetical protein